MFCFENNSVPTVFLGMQFKLNMNYHDIINIDYSTVLSLLSLIAQNYVFFPTSSHYYTIYATKLLTRPVEVIGNKWLLS